MSTEIKCFCISIQNRSREAFGNSPIIKHPPNNAEKIHSKG